MADVKQEEGWLVIAKRMAKPTDSLKVQRVGYVWVKMTARPIDQQTALGRAQQGAAWNAGTISPYEHVALPEDDALNTLAQWHKDVEAAGLALIRVP